MGAVNNSETFSAVSLSGGKDMSSGQSEGQPAGCPRRWDLVYCDPGTGCLRCRELRHSGCLRGSASSPII